MTASVASRRSSRFPGARITAWDRGLTRTAAVPAMRSPQSAELALRPTRNSRSPAAQSPQKTQPRISSPLMAPPVKRGSRSSSTKWDRPTPALPTAEWKISSPLPGAPMPAVCSLPQPSFAAAQAANNIIFRIPTPVFGAGLIENLDDSTLLNNQAEQPEQPLSAFPVLSTTTATTAPSAVSAGRRRTSRCTSSRARLTTWRWASPTSCSRKSARCPGKMAAAPAA